MSHSRTHAGRPATALVDGRGRKYLTAEERARFLEAARRAAPADQTFALTLAHTGTRVSEVLAIRAGDIDLPDRVDHAHEQQVICTTTTGKPTTTRFR